MPLLVTVCVPEVSVVTADRYTGTGVAVGTVPYPVASPVGAGGGGSGTKFENLMLVIMAIFSGYTVGLCRQRSPCQRGYVFTDIS